MDEITHEGGRLKGKAMTADGLIDVVTKFAKLMEYPVQIKIDEVGATLDYKALIAIWLREIARQASERSGRTYTEDDMRAVLYHKFFGYTDRKTIGRTVIEPALITITYPREKTRPELYHFCRQIEEWCSDNGFTLPEKPSQYQEDKERETA